MLHSIANNKKQAFLIHLGLSIVIGLTFTLAALLIWYPGLIAKATGSTKIFLMVIGIDICLGPLLTFVVFNKKKRELARDLYIIFAIQLAALFYGLYTVTIARPVYYAFAVDRFELIQAHEVNRESLAKAKLKQFESMPLFGPEWVYAVKPTDPKEKSELLSSALNGGSDLAQLPELYQNYSQQQAQVIEKALPLELLTNFNTHLEDTQIDQLLSGFKPIEKYGYLPLTAKKLDMSVIIKLSDGSPVDIIDLRPW